MDELDYPVQKIDKPDYVALYLTAEGQRGYFTTRQAHESGISDRLLTHWVKSGRFYRVAHGIYRLRDFPVSPREELVVPLLWAGRQSALSYETALEVHDLGDILPTVTHVTVSEPFTPRTRPGVIVHHEPLSEREIVLRDDLRLTTVERTIADCLKWGTDLGQLILAAQQALDRGLVHPQRLQQAVCGAGATEDFASVFRPKIGT